MWKMVHYMTPSTIYGIASGMKYLHENNILHRDLKPCNILMDSMQYPKIADFGLSKQIHEKSDPMTPESLAGIKGTPQYIQLETFTSLEQTKSGDVYAFGMTIYGLLTLQVPFKNLNIFEIHIEFLNGRHPPFKDPIDDAYRNLIERCWSNDPKERPTFAEIVEELETNRDFITGSINENDFLDYVESIKDYKVSFSRERIVKLERANADIYTKDFLKGHKILFVMLYDCTLNIKENPRVAKKFLSEPQSEGDASCFKKAAEFYGIDIVVVSNYKDAIKELTRQTINGKCDYYAAWIMSGLPYDIPLPDGGNQYLVVQFIDCLLQFWNKGGSVVLLAEGDPLTFQANLFLEKLVFPDKTKTKLRFGGNHKGMKCLMADKSGKLDKPGVFDKSNDIFEKLQREPLGQELAEIYEGETISYGSDDKEKYSPFIPFMRDSENGISAYFYPAKADMMHQTGDIIIDGGYTKIFDKMTEEGTFRYIRNINAWTANAESKIIRGVDPKECRPDAVIFTLDESQKCTLQEPPEVASSDDISKMKRLFAIDFSASVSGYDLFHNEVKSIFDKYYQSGDSIMIWGTKARIIDYEQMRKIYTNREGNGSSESYVIAEKLASDQSIPRQHLILVTASVASICDLEKCDTILRKNNFRFQYVTYYTIGDKADLSVGAPFTRGCASKTIGISGNGSRREIAGENVVDFNVLQCVDLISCVGQFNECFSSLFNATKQKMMGTSGDSSLKSKFDKLKDKLKSSGDFSAQTEQRIEILIGIASGTHSNVLNIDSITAMSVE